MVVVVAVGVGGAALGAGDSGGLGWGILTMIPLGLGSVVVVVGAVEIWRTRGTSGWIVQEANNSIHATDAALPLSLPFIIDTLQIIISPSIRDIIRKSGAVRLKDP